MIRMSDHHFPQDRTISFTHYYTLTTSFYMCFCTSFFTKQFKLLNIWYMSTAEQWELAGKSNSPVNPVAFHEEEMRGVWVLFRSRLGYVSTWQSIECLRNTSWQALLRELINYSCCLTLLFPFLPACGSSRPMLAVCGRISCHYVNCFSPSI